MFIIGEIFQSVAYLVNAVSQILIWLIIIRIIVSWLPVDPYHSIVLFLVQATDPILRPFRRIPLRIGMLDLTPIMAVITLQLISRILVRMLMTAAYQFGAG